MVSLLCPGGVIACHGCVTGVSDRSHWDVLDMSWERQGDHCHVIGISRMCQGDVKGVLWVCQGVSNGCHWDIKGVSWVCQGDVIG